MTHIREPSTCRLPQSVWISPRTCFRSTASMRPRVGGKIVGRDAEARVYQAAHFGWFYIFDGLTSDSFASEQEAIADVKTWKDRSCLLRAHRSRRVAQSA